jgi:DNA-binding protein H-NS
MNNACLKSMSSDELWMLHEEVSALLTARISAEKAILEKRLSQLNQVGVEFKAGTPKRRRTYPPVVPKFSNPDNPLETWAGRGKQPRWLRKQLGSGKLIDDFRVGA